MGANHGTIGMLTTDFQQKLCNLTLKAILLLNHERAQALSETPVRMNPASDFNGTLKLYS